jgi:hypothetical protein
MLAPLTLAQTPAKVQRIGVLLQTAPNMIRTPGPIVTSPQMTALGAT